MALNATPGASDANSYVTLEEANAYFVDRPHSSAWGESSEQESMLILASRMLDWYVHWKGYRSSTTQSMLWPRTGVIRRDASEIATDIIPSEVKIAVYELALSSIEEDRTIDSALAGLEEIKAGSLTVKANINDPDSPDVIPEKIWRILSDLYSRGSMSVVRLMRA